MKKNILTYKMKKKKKKVFVAQWSRPKDGDDEREIGGSEALRPESE